MRVLPQWLDGESAKKPYHALALESKIVVRPVANAFFINFPMLWCGCSICTTTAHKYE